MEIKYRDKISRLLSEVLRHKPQKLGLILDQEGYVDVDVLIVAINSCGVVNHLCYREDIVKIVAENNKQRFAFNSDNTKIRANQGHSVNIDLGLKSIQPPTELYHGSDLKFLQSIKKDGLLKMTRQHVHLTDNVETAIKVGQRKGKDLIFFKVDSNLMHFDGYKFYQSDNGVWLTDAVPSKYLKIVPNPFLLN